VRFHGGLEGPWKPLEVTWKGYFHVVDRLEAIRGGVVVEAWWWKPESS